MGFNEKLQEIKRLYSPTLATFLDGTFQDLPAGPPRPLPADAPAVPRPQKPGPQEISSSDSARGTASSSPAQNFAPTLPAGRPPPLADTLGSPVGTATVSIFTGTFEWQIEIPGWQISGPEGRFQAERAE